MSERFQPTTTDDAVPPAVLARQLMRASLKASLATRMPDPDGAPFASLVTVAFDYDASPIVLLSDLSDHTRNINSDPRVGLLFDGTSGLAVPLSGARVSIQGHAEQIDDPRLRARYLARHADAELYVQFQDFKFYRVAVKRAQLIGGYAKAFWLAGDEVALVAAGSELAAAEPEILAHMASDHHDAIQLYAQALGAPAGDDGWLMTGVDPEGADLRKDGEAKRLSFGKLALSPDDVRGELVRAAKRARLALDSPASADISAQKINGGT